MKHEARVFDILHNSKYRLFFNFLYIFLLNIVSATGVISPTILPKLLEHEI